MQSSEIRPIRAKTRYKLKWIAATSTAFALVTLRLMDARTIASIGSSARTITLNLANARGLVGTNTIRQNYSREAGLDYIVGNGGTITEAVSSMVWPGEANVHVSIVNWIKGAEKGKKRLYIQEGNKPDVGWRHSLSTP